LKLKFKFKFKLKLRFKVKLRFNLGVGYRSWKLEEKLEGEGVRVILCGGGAHRLSRYWWDFFRGLYTAPVGTVYKMARRGELILDDYLRPLRYDVTRREDSTQVCIHTQEGRVGSGGGFPYKAVSHISSSPCISSSRDACCIADEREGEAGNRGA
jgi:hypothetical protein